MNEKPPLTKAPTDYPRMYFVKFPLEVFRMCYKLKKKSGNDLPKTRTPSSDKE